MEFFFYIFSYPYDKEIEARQEHQRLYRRWIQLSVMIYTTWHEQTGWSSSLFFTIKERPTNRRRLFFQEKMPSKQRKKMKFIGKKERERRRKSYSRCIDQRTGVELTLVPLLSKSSEWAQCVCMCHIKIRSHTTREDYIYILLAGRDMIQFNSTKKKKKCIHFYNWDFFFFFD